MKNLFTAMAILFLMVGLSAPVYAGLDGFLADLNVRARVDHSGFHTSLSSQFGIPLPHVQFISTRVTHPADAFMCLQLGQMTNQNPDRVLQVYESHKGQGWGVIAKELGIKPGSAEFHALKNGNFSLGGRQVATSHKGKGKGKGKAKSKGRGNGKKGKHHNK